MSFPRYPSYRDSGVPWLGEVPSEWKVTRLKRLGVIRYGIGEPPSYEDEGVPLIRATNVDHGQIDPVGMVFVDPAQIPEKRILWLREGDIIVVRSGAYTGDSAIVCREHTPAIAGFDMVIRPTDCEAKFLQYALLSSYLRDAQIELERLRAAQPHLNAEELGSCLVLIPPAAEQTAIAAFLDRETAKIDALVEAQRRLIELLKEKRQAVISHAVTKGLDPTVPMKDSGIEWLGEVPAHWEVARLRSVARIQTGIAKGKDYGGAAMSSIPYLRVANVQEGHIDLADLAMIEIPFADAQRYLLRAGDVLMNEGGDFDKLGRGGIWKAEVDPCIHQNHVFAIRSFAIPSEWISWSNAGSIAKFFFMSRAKQSTNLASISSANLMELPILVPPREEIAQLTSLLQLAVTQLDLLVTGIESGISLLQERRAALITAAVTGRVDLRSHLSRSEEEKAA